jgi:hypothetical protein
MLANVHPHAALGRHTVLQPGINKLTIIIFNTAQKLFDLIRYNNRHDPH